MLKVAIAGCANVGKTTLFNLLTGKKNKTGNWEGVTVDISNAKMLFSKEIQIFDLPGIKSIIGTNQSLDQVTSIKFLLEQKLDLIVNVVTVEHLKKDLKLSIELYETGTPILMILVDQNGKLDNNSKLDFFNCEVLHVNFTTKGVIGEIINKIKQYCANRHQGFLESPLNHCKVMNYPIDINSNIIESINLFVKSEDNYTKIQTLRNEFISSILKDLSFKQTNKKEFSNAIDAIVMNRFLAIPIFIFVVSLILCMTIIGGDIFKSMFENFVDTIIIEPVINILNLLGAPSFISKVYKFGIGSGIRTIASFIPLLMILYTALGFLDESGYMTRVSITMGRLASKVGLSGKAIIPLIVGFGCNVPAIMGTRIIEDSKQRLLTIILIPFMSCGARLTVFALFSSAFFPKNAAIVICCLYFFSIFLASVVALTLKPYFGKNNQTNVSISRLPKYKTPRISNILKHSITKIKHFILETGMTITVMSVILYLLASVPSNVFSLKLNEVTLNETSENSLLVACSKKFAYVFEPIGIDSENWPATVSLLTGIIAKEVVTPNLITLYEIKEQSEIDPRELVQKYFHYDTNAFAYLLFVLIYFPCISVFSVMQKEVSTKVAVYSSIFYTVFAYIIAATFYKISFYTNNSVVLSMLVLIALISFIAYILRFLLSLKYAPVKGH